MHATQDISLKQFVDDFGIKYTPKEDLDCLIASVWGKYPFKIDWDTKQYIGLHLKWDYNKHKVQVSVDYVEQALKEFEHDILKQKHYRPSKMERPDYGQTIQYAKIDNITAITLDKIKFLQKVTGKLLFYARAVDNTMMHAPKTLHPVLTLSPLTMPPSTSSIMLHATPMVKPSTWQVA